MATNIASRRVSASLRGPQHASTQIFGGGRAQPSAKGEKLQRVLEKAGRLGLLGDMPGQEALREGESEPVSNNMSLGSRVLLVYS